MKEEQLNCYQLFGGNRSRCKKQNSRFLEVVDDERPLHAATLAYDRTTVRPKLKFLPLKDAIDTSQLGDVALEGFGAVGKFGDANPHFIGE